MAKVGELPMSAQQHKRAVAAEPVGKRKSRATDHKTSAEATANGPVSHGATGCRRRNAIRRRRPVSVDSVVVEICTTALMSPQGARLALPPQGDLPCRKFINGASVTELSSSKFRRAAKAAQNAGYVIELMKKARHVNPFEDMRHSRSDSELDLLLAECCLDEECANH
ncbi:hypothetical protein AAVH_27621 [Aphelenchoides avenae]|nr:hypothetical protein AAVH_27621 [Aphelenchus avenae]